MTKEGNEKKGFPVPAIVFKRIRYTRETGEKAFVRITLSLSGKEESSQAQEEGILAAAFAAINNVVPNDLLLENYEVHSAARGTDALAKVSVTVSKHGREVTAYGEHHDTVVASVLAYINALNRYRM